jgi:acetyl esterase/lipase
MGGLIRHMLNIATLIHVQATTPDARKLLRVDLLKGFLLGGTSAGANFTAGIAHLVRDTQLNSPLTGLAFLAGNVCHPDARPAQYRDRILSVDEINDAPGLTRKSIDYFAGRLEPHGGIIRTFTYACLEKYGAPPSDTRLSPLLFQSHAGLAKKAYFAICGWDPRRDESLLFEEILRQNGTETSKHVYPGLPHGFWTTCPELAVSRKWEEEYVKGVRWLLQ